MTWTAATTAPPRAVDEAQLRGLLAQVDRRRGSRLLVVTAAPRWSGPAQLQTDAGPVRVVTGQSVLAVRAAMVDHPDAFLVVLTPLPMQQLGEEVRARAWRQRAHCPSAWDAVKALCKVAAIDPTLRGEQWMVDLLVAVAPARGYAQPPSQVLDRETAWRNLYRYGLGLGVAPSIRALLRWATTPEAREAIGRLDDDTRRRIAAQLAVDAGPAAAPVLDLVAADRGGDALALGLVVEALWRDGDAVARTLLQERHLSQQPLDDGAASDWARAAVADVRAEVGDAPDEAIGGVLRRADEILATIAPDARAASSVLDGGFEGRLARLGALLGQALDDESSHTVRAAVSALDDVRAHLRATRDRARVSRAEAALRLSRRAVLGGDEPATATGLPALARRYITEGAWVDAARHRIAEGETVPELGDVYHRLLDRLRDDGRERDRAFAATIASEAARPTAGPADLRSASVLAIEHVLAGVVAPLAAHAPVLLLVIDGLSHAAAVPLDEDLRGEGWQPYGPEGGALPPVVAALPTVTQVSRASLLCGRLATGGQDVERDGFGSAPPLVDAGRGQRPKLFHKSDLGTIRGEIAPAVRDALADPGQHVVGVVVNAVDDHLDKGSQLRLADGMQGVPVLKPLLDAAAQARRVVVLTSDHGHILGSKQQVISAPGGGERFRVTEKPPAAYEVELSGARVLRGDNRIVAAAEETVRYIAVAKHGYHGGATPAEALCPLLVLVYGNEHVPGWEPLVPQVPRWWEPELAPVVVDLTPVAEAVPTPVAPPPVIGPSQPSLLDPEPDVVVSPGAGGSVVGASWVSELLASPRLSDQRRLAGRVRLEDDDLVALMRVLDAAGGTASGASLQRTLEVSPSRLRGKLEAARTLLNVDGYAVLRIEADGTAVLNRQLLADQFELRSLGGWADG